MEFIKKEIKSTYHIHESEIREAIKEYIIRKNNTLHNQIKIKLDDINDIEWRGKPNEGSFTTITSMYAKIEVISSLDES